MRRRLLACAALLMLTVPLAAQDANGAVAVYDFTYSGDGTIRDISGVGDALDLLPDPNEGELKWGPWGEFETSEADPALFLQSLEAATKINDAIREANQFTLEVWLTPDTLSQSGPARIVTLSASTNVDDRNITLGQSNDAYAVRLRLSELGAEPSVTEYPTPGGLVSLDVLRQHVVVTFAACEHCGARLLRVYVDGEPAIDQGVMGDLSGWDSDFQLTLGNEATGDRQWAGALWQVGFYSRVMLEGEVKQRYADGR